MKIRGNVVGTTQKPEKVIVKATDLTDDEKAQARSNIGVPDIDVLVEAVIAALPDGDEVSY